MPVMVDMISKTLSSKTMQKKQGLIHQSSSVDRIQSYSRTSEPLDEESDEDEEFLVPESEPEVSTQLLQFKILFHWSWSFSN